MSNYIYIHLGLGDLFLTRLLFDSNNYQYNLYINLDLIKECRENKVENINFIKFILESLFQDRKLKYISKKQLSKNIISLYDLNIYNFKTGINNLKKYFPFDKSIVQINKPFLIFHTKIRICNKDFSYFLNPLLEFISSFKTNYTIVILGERKMSVNSESKAHNIISIYELLARLKEKNQVIDMTEEELYNVPNKDIFLRDINIISQAEMNFGLGWGGNFAMSWAFTDKFCFYMDNLQHPILDFFEKEIEGSIVRDIQSFIKKINSYSSISL